MRGTVSGSVVNKSSLEPIAGVTVRISPSEEERPSHFDSRSHVTDDRGCFSSEDLEAGRWIVTIEARDGKTAQQEAHVFDRSVSVVNFELQVGPPKTRLKGRKEAMSGSASPTPGAVRGLVIDSETQRPVSEATITVVQAAGPAPDIAPVTDSQGRFAYDDLPPGLWVLQAVSPDGRTGEATAFVVEGDSLELTIEVSPA